MERKKILLKTIENYNPKLIFLAWIVIAAGIWISVAAVFYFAGMDFIKETDSLWYWRTVLNLDAFDPAIQPLYPIIVRGLIELFPEIPQGFLGQLVSLCCYALSVPFMYQIFKVLNVSKPTEMTFLWALFPFTGVTLSVYPRANALLLLFTVLAFWGYIKNKPSVFLISVALLPLIHKSALFLLIFLIPIALFEKKITWWMLVLVCMPTLAYILMGTMKHGSILWYFNYYQRYTPVTSLPLVDGLLGSVVLGLRGSLTDLIQGVITLGYYLLAFYLLFSKVWQKHLFLLSAILPILVLGLALPNDQIMSLITYTSFSIMPFSLSRWQEENWLGKKHLAWVTWTIVICAFLSQIGFSFYALQYHGI